MTSWGSLWTPSGHLGPSWGYLGRTWGLLGSTWGLHKSCEVGIVDVTKLFEHVFEDIAQNAPPHGSQHAQTRVRKPL
jgi:hypothetical protein